MGFRDSKKLNYWGRILSALEKQGCKIYYKYLSWLKDCEDGRNLSNGAIVTSSYWLIVDEQVVGVVRIRHQEDPTGGHIGYDISPNYRRKGYGSMILRLALEKTKEFQIEDVVVTCEINNVASKKIIEGHDGIFTGIVYDEEDDEYLRRYVIRNK